MERRTLQVGGLPARRSDEMRLTDSLPIRFCAYRKAMTKSETKE